MKKITLIFVLFIVFTSCKGNKGEDPTKIKNETEATENNLKRYDLKSGIVAYKMTFSGEVPGGTVKGEGTENLYFKEWGAIELREEQSTTNTRIKILGHETNETTTAHTMNKINNGEIYVVNFDGKYISKSRNPLMDIFKAGQVDVVDAGKKMLENMGGKLAGNENYRGYDCQVWELPGGKQWIYKGLMLKLEMTVMGITTIKEATTMKFDANIPDSKFDLPDFPVNEEEGFQTNDEMDLEMEAAKKDLETLRTLSFEDWKKSIQQADPEMKNRSDDELREIYTMMQKMASMGQSN